VNLYNTPLETFGMLRQAFGDDCLSRSQSNMWYKMFKEDLKEVADEALKGRSLTWQNDDSATRVRQLMNFDRRMSF